MYNECDMLSNEEISLYDSLSINDYYKQVVEQREQENKNKDVLLLNQMFSHLSEMHNNNKDFHN